eukprot:4347596-Prymnesium_polylepis.2
MSHHGARYGVCVCVRVRYTSQLIDVATIHIPSRVAGEMRREERWRARPRSAARRTPVKRWWGHGYGYVVGVVCRRAHCFY